MAWYDGLNSLKGQLTNFARGVLAEESEQEKGGERKASEEKSTSESQAPVGAAVQGPSTSNDVWNEALQNSDRFLGQDTEALQPSWEETPTKPRSSPSKSYAGSDSSPALARGIADFFLSLNPDGSRQVANAGTQCNSSLNAGDFQQLQSAKERLTEENVRLTNEVGVLARRVRDLESQIAVSQDENANLSTGLEELDIQHQQAIEQVITVKDETQKLYDLLKVEYQELKLNYVQLQKENKNLNRRSVELDEAEAEKTSLSKALQECSEELSSFEKRSGELSNELKEAEDGKFSLIRELEKRDEELFAVEEQNSELRAKIDDLNEELNRSRDSLPVILENNVVEEAELRINQLHGEVTILREVRTNLERELEITRERAEELTRDLRSVEVTSRNISNTVRDQHQSETNELKKEVEELKKNLCEKEGIINSLSREKKEWEQSETKSSDQEALFNKIRNLETTLQEMDRELEKAQKSCESKDLKMCEIVLEANATEEKHKMEKQELYNKIGELEAEKSETKSELLKEIESLQISKEDIQKALDKAIKNHETILNEFEISKDLSREKELEFKNQVKSKDDEVHKVSARLEEVEAAYLALEAHFVSLTQSKDEEILSLKALLEEQKATLLDSLATVASFQNSSSAQETLKENEALEKKLEMEEKKNSELTVETELLKKELAALQLQLHHFKDIKGQLEGENAEIKRSLQLKHGEGLGHLNEKQRLSTLLSEANEKCEQLLLEKIELNSKCEELQKSLMERETTLQELETSSKKQIGTLSQETESLKNQLEYVSQLLSDVERQEAEGQTSSDSACKSCPNGCEATQKELSSIKDAYFSEQSENKILNIKLEELKEKYSKADSQLMTLKKYLMESEESHTAELMTAKEKIHELQNKLTLAEEVARSSSTAYTSASIRANQQVESLTIQVKSLTDLKERLENELSKSEDEALRQSAAVTNLQAVLHQFKKDKQKDIEFETERIKQNLKDAHSRNDELLNEIKVIQEQLREAKIGLVAASRLSEQLEVKGATVEKLKEEVGKLTKKVTETEEGVRLAQTSFEGKIDRNLIKNLIVGYMCAPPKNKEPALRVISTVLELSKEEKQKIGLEPGGSHQPSLSEAFIRFLETESQPKPEVLLPLGQPEGQSSLARTPGHSRKSSQSSGSILLTDAPSLQQFTLGRNSGSILKDVLKDRTT